MFDQAKRERVVSTYIYICSMKRKFLLDRHIYGFPHIREESPSHTHVAVVFFSLVHY